MTIDFNWYVLWEALPVVLPGVPLTLLISVVGISIGFVLALPLGLMSLSRSRWLRWPAIVYVEIFRGTPVLVQVLFVFYGLPQILGHSINSLTASFIAIAVNSSSYFSEIVRGSVSSIDKGQTEAGLSTGLSGLQTFRYIVWPQALRRMIPPVGNQCIISLKDTSLFSVIGVGELVRQGQIYISSTFNALETYFLVAIIYLCMTLTLSFLLRWLENSGLLGQRS
ncbi:MAG TPA: amino acid ABC transporter permease [Burkholderiaceae bacterium]|nr:amino acid ABC transporter permease [Burkholderiaceae bacterium]